MVIKTILFSFVLFEIVNTVDTQVISISSGIYLFVNNVRGLGNPKNFIQGQGKPTALLSANFNGLSAFCLLSACFPPAFRPLSAPSLHAGNTLM
jgi:hypothetical protein